MLDLPRITSLLQSRIVKLAADCQLLIQSPCLTFSRIDSITKGFQHVGPLYQTIVPRSGERERVMAENEFTFDYFRDEFKRFWDMCGDARQTVDTLQRALNGLAFVAANTPEQSERITHLFQVAALNYSHRLPYFLMKEIRNV